MLYDGMHIRKPNTERVPLVQVSTQHVHESRAELRGQMEIFSFGSKSSVRVITAH